MIKLSDILGDVRGDDYYYSLKDFVQPDDPIIQKIAFVLAQSDSDIIATSQDFVHRVVKYKEQSGEIFRYPAETLEIGEADCDDMAILLCSILRNYLPAEEVYVAVGNMNGLGHAWVVTDSRIIESTASPKHKVDKVKYRPEVLFNDRYAYSMKPNGFGFQLIKRKHQVYNIRVV